MTIEEELKSTVRLELPKKVLLNITYTKNCITDKVLELLKPFDLSTEQYNVLRIVRGQKGKPINMAGIQERMLARTSNTTRLVDKLLLKNLVHRTLCKTNRRKMEITITERGLQVLEEIDPLLQAYENELANKLTMNELNVLNELLEKYRG